MEKDFEIIVDSYLNDNVGITEHFISDKLANHLKQNLLALYKKKAMTAAGVGNNEKFAQDSTVRGDFIYWLDRKNNNEYENEFFDHIDEFILYLNKSCFAGITGYEFHYSIYEKGTFYKKHLDQFNNNPTRRFSMISYLNADWHVQDGGELLIHQAYNNKRIAPTQGKTVFFKSNELEHEVLVTNQIRMSITGWLKRG